jgi:hypothetical protein
LARGFPQFHTGVEIGIRGLVAHQEELVAEASRLLHKGKRPRESFRFVNATTVGFSLKGAPTTVMAVFRNDGIANLCLVE